MDGPVARNRLRQIAGGENAAHTGNAESLVGPDGDDPRVCARHRDQLHVQRIVEPDIGSVLLRAGHAFDGAESGK